MEKWTSYLKDFANLSEVSKKKKKNRKNSSDLPRFEKRSGEFRFRKKSGQKVEKRKDFHMPKIEGEGERSRESEKEEGSPQFYRHCGKRKKGCPQSVEFSRKT